MARAIHKLTAMQVAKLTDKGFYPDGGRLYLNVAPTGSKSWVLRYRGRYMGLGSFPAVSLAAARQAAKEAGTLLDEGVDPLDVRKSPEPVKEAAAAIASPKGRKALRAEGAAVPGTFDAFAEQYVSAREAAWRNPKHRQQWRNTLKTYASPIIGRKKIPEIDVGDILRILEPIWATKIETASRLRGRIEKVIGSALVQIGQAGAPNPARLQGNLEHILVKKTLIENVEHHAAMPYADLSAFMLELRSRDALAARALEFCVLTATRTNETLGAEWREIDLAAKAWNIPGARMKKKKMHRIPLSGAALAILEAMPRLEGNPYIFPGMKDGQPLSNMAFLMLLRRMGQGDVTAHGFRSSFSDWAAEETNFPRAIVEAALSHAVGTKTARAYQRGDVFEKRRALMDAWAAYCLPKRSENVIPLRAKETA